MFGIFFEERVKSYYWKFHKLFFLWLLEEISGLYPFLLYFKIYCHLECDHHFLNMLRLFAFSPRDASAPSNKLKLGPLSQLEEKVAKGLSL